MANCKMCVFWICFIATVSLVSCGPSRQKRSRMCYNDLEIDDCFSNQPPFDNTDGLLPQSPTSINTTFRLYTRTCTSPKVVKIGKGRMLALCEFDPKLKTKFISHGFLQHGQVTWVRDMAAELLKRERMNVFTVDWGRGSGFPYSQASANTRVVGAEISRMINFLESSTGLTKDLVHIIGHSLGAHVAGYAGNRSPGLARITGLDPADPDFKDTDNAVHLDLTDAEFVDIIHSDGSEFDYVSGFGWIKAVGHIDFYPNGGMDQPGCAPESVSNLMSAAYYHGLTDAEDTLSCSHSRSIYLFMESINAQCPFYGHSCPSMAALDSNENNCLRCRGRVCPEMGYNADKTRARGSFYLKTRAVSPFCGQSQHVEVEFGNMHPTTGQVRIQLIGHDGSVDNVILRSGVNEFLSGDHRDVLVVDRERLDDIAEVHVSFVRPMGITWWWTSARTRQYEVVVYRVTVTTAGDGHSIHFCGDHQTITNGNSITLTRSSTDPNECMLPPVNVQNTWF